MKKNKTKSLKIKLMNKQKVLFSIFLLFFSITSCKLSGKENTESNSDSDYNSVKSAVQNWNKAHQDYDFTAMQKIYTEKVLYYGKLMASNDIVLSKQSFIKKYKDFTQKILGDLAIENLGEQKMKVSFIKQASFGGKLNEYPSYLVVQKTDSGWKICTESDSITDKNLAKKAENKNSSSLLILKRVYIKNNNVFVEHTNGKEKQLTYNGTDREPIIINANTVFFIRKQYDDDDNEGMVLMTVEADTQKEKIIKILDSYSCFEEPKISNDKKHIYYLDCVYATSYVLIKLNIYTGESQQLLDGYWYHEIASGNFKDFLLIYTSGFEENKKGRQFYYRLCNNKGETYKTFADETAMYNFAKANNINLPEENSTSNETPNTENRDETNYTSSISINKGTFSLKYLYVESKGWTTFTDDFSNSQVSIGSHDGKEFRAHKTFIDVQSDKILLSANNKIERVLRFNKTLSSTKDREDSFGKYKYILYEGTVSVGEYGNQKTGNFEYGIIVMDNKKYQYFKTFDGLDTIFIF